MHLLSRTEAFKKHWCLLQINTDEEEPYADLIRKEPKIQQGASDSIRKTEFECDGYVITREWQAKGASLDVVETAVACQTSVAIGCGCPHRSFPPILLRRIQCQTLGEFGVKSTQQLRDA